MVRRPVTGDLLDTPDAGPAAIRGSVLRGGGYALGLLLALASAPFLVRHLGIEDFGRFVLVGSIITLVSGITEAGLQAVGTREYAVREPAERDRLMRNLLGLRIALVAPGVGAALLFCVLAGYDRTLVLGTAITGLGLLLTSIAMLLTVPLAANLRLGWISAIELGRNGLLVALTLTLIVLGASLLAFFWVAVAVGLAGLVATVGLVRRIAPLTPAFHPAEWWALVRDTIAYAAALALNVAYFRIAIVLMSLLTTELETAYFATSYRVIEVLLPVSALVVGTLFPILARAARDDRERLRYASQRIFEVSLIAGAAVVVVLELGAPTILQVLAGSDGAPSVDVLRIQAPALAATFVAVACGYPLLSLRRHRALLVGNVVALAASVTLCFALIPVWGARGAAVATTIAEIGLAVTNLLLLTRSADGVRLSAAIVGPVALATALGLAAFLLPAAPIVQAAIGGTAYLGTLVALRRLPPELMDAVRRRRGRLA